MKILGIETSCDDTGVAILEISEKNSENFKVFANEVASQIKIHKKYGGVFPFVAKREHQKNILPTFVKSLKTAKLLKPKIQITNSKSNHSLKNQNDKFKIIKTILEREPELAKKLIPFLKKYSKPDINYIAITNGPGLEPCLWVGVNFARAISYYWDISIIPVNHIEGHILVNFIDSNYKLQITNYKTEFPAIALVVSGGHTQLILINKIGDYKILGETRDDAAGECFDKAAKILGLGYPGGPEIAKLANKITDITDITDTRYLLNNRYRVSVKLPRPMINTKDYDMSFSGLKTAILYSHQKQPKKIQKNKDYIYAMCGEIQQTITDVLLKKTFKAVNDFNAKTIILGGGVSANSELKKQFQEKVDNYNKSNTTDAPDMLELVFPPANLSTDNGLMIAVAGYFNRNKKIGWQNLQADSNLRIDK